MSRSPARDRFVAAAQGVFGAALVAAVLATAVAAQTRPATVGGPFTLTAPDGTSVTEATYRGKWLLVYFGFTHCPVTCPTALMQIADALARLGGDADDVGAIFITLDPQRDTPEVMREYTGSFDPRIVGLTGGPEQIAAVAQAYGVYAVVHRTGPGAGDYTIDHSTYLYLMDPVGQFARGFDADTPGERIAEVIRGLIAERGGRGARDAAATSGDGRRPQSDPPPAARPHP